MKFSIKTILICIGLLFFGRQIMFGSGKIVSSGELLKAANEYSLRRNGFGSLLPLDENVPSLFR